MARPTEQASYKFNKAYRFADQAGGFFTATHVKGNEDKGHSYLCSAVRELAEGMQHLSDGLRATYILLEQVKNGDMRR
jgi:hypothetical protein